MSKKYNAAIVGCGSIAQAHMQGYERLDNVDVVAVVDPLEPARKMYMDKYGIPNGYATVQEMLAKSEPDIVSVCVWHLLHDTVTAEVAIGPSVKGIICEKPMAIGMGRADAMVDICEANEVKLAISHQRRFTPGWEKAKQLVENGAIGIPLRADLRVKEGLANWGTHSIDGARYILGDPIAEWVMGAVERRTNKYERNTAIEDACMGLIHFGGSLQFFIQSDLWDRNCDAGKFFIRGTEGMLHVTETVLKLFNSETQGWESVDLGLKEGDQAIGGNTNAAQTRELIEWVEGGPESRGSGRIARDTVEVMMAMYESARLNRVVTLPLEEKEYPLGLMIDEGKLPLEDEERYDIRGFLDRSQIDENRFQQLLDDGIPHHQALRIIHEEMGTKVIR
ncbi:MAG: Gfo/Idh/MocA family oxidoreductase [Chloroflexota bacterium]|nr:Gfo/Idh/MocA family oxidoreductase [Chloroflexota bacterium]